MMANGGKFQSDKIKGFWTKREQDAFVQGLNQVSHKRKG
jgi:hypothetical protein